MADIRHRVGIRAPASHVFDAVATADGLRGWWTDDVRGDDTVGGSLAFYFGGDEPSAVMEVVEHSPSERVVWRCVGGPDEWTGTTFTFALAPTETETVLLFTNEGWREPVEFLHHCTTKWGLFLLGLKHGLEGGRATPFPGEPAVSSWG